MRAATQGDSDVVVSVVTTLYRSAAFIEEFCRRVAVEAARISPAFEIVLVNDGSPDESLNVALKLMELDPRIRVVDLSRNFGQHKAIMTGLAHAVGDLVFLIDCDLEEDPELLTRFHAEMQQAQADVVYGVQEERQGSFVKRWSGQLFYKLFEALSSYRVPSNPLNARLMTRRYVDSLLLHQERELYMAGLWAMTGYKQVAVTAIKHCRGESSYTFRKRVSMAINALTSFSSTPLYFIFYLGIVVLLLAFGAALYLVAHRLFVDENIPGWASVMVSVWLLGGINIFCMGIVSIYLSKVFIETKQRPYTVIREIHSRQIDAGAAHNPPAKAPVVPTAQAG
jgi:putative glycosyltransferase